VQRSALDEPKTKPQPLATLQLSVPTRAALGAAPAASETKTPVAKASAPIAKPIFFLNISFVLLFFYPSAGVCHS
jgi:hypothetical protein